MRHITTVFYLRFTTYYNCILSMCRYTTYYNCILSTLYDILQLYFIYVIRHITTVFYLRVVIRRFPYQMMFVSFNSTMTGDICRAESVLALILEHMSSPRNLVGFDVVNLRFSN
jgi:hypothetical protein